VRLDQITVADAVNFQHSLLEPRFKYAPERDGGADVPRVSVAEWEAVGGAPRPKQHVLDQAIPRRLPGLCLGHVGGAVDRRRVAVGG